MTKTSPRQLELPVMVDVNGKVRAIAASGQSTSTESRSLIVDSGFHKPASADDQSIYKAISDNYFAVAPK